MTAVTLHLDLTIPPDWSASTDTWAWMFTRPRYSASSPQSAFASSSNDGGAGTGNTIRGAQPAVRVNRLKARRRTADINGSTGEPFVCYADQHQLEIRWAATQRGMEWTGYRFGDRCARLWHQTLGMSWAQSLRERIDAWFNRRLFIPAFEMSDANIERFVAKLIRSTEPLADFPELGRRVPEEPEQANVRELVVQTYRIIYRVEAERILIATVLHGSRDLVRLEEKPWQAP